MTVRYYVASAALLPVGITIGVVLARLDEDSAWHERLMVAHASVNLLGWIGITALGTLVTLWPTMLRTRIAPGVEKSATRALPLLVAAVVLVGSGPLLDVPYLLVAGLALYLAGLGMLASGWVRAARSRPPASFSTLSVAAALVWLVGSIAFIAAAGALEPKWMEIHEVFEELTPFIAVGFGAQLLLGALAYLAPVAVGGGPTPVRAANEVLDRAARLRLVAGNAGLVVALLPVPSPVGQAAGAVALVAFASSLPLLTLALRTSRLTRRRLDEARGAQPADR